MPKISEITKGLLIMEMKKAIEILEHPKCDIESGCSQDAPELRDLLKQVRRHSMELDKEMYPQWNYGRDKR